MFDNTSPSGSELPWTTPQDPERAAWFWQHFADELTEWAKANVIIRTDAYGRYRSWQELQSHPDRGPSCIEKRHLHPYIIRQHFCATDRGQIIGPLTTDLDNLVQCVTWDIDKHDETVDAVANCRYALKLHDRLRRMGYKPLLTDSNGAGGFHLRLPVLGYYAAGQMRSFGLWLTQDWTDWVPPKPEVFPKQNRHGEPLFKLPKKPITFTPEMEARHDQLVEELRREERRGQAEEN